MIKAKQEEPFKTVINKYLQKSSLSPNDVFFIKNCMQINPEDKIENQINQMNIRNKKLKILVQLIERTIISQEFVNSKDIICPKCQKPCRIKIEAYIFIWLY